MIGESGLAGVNRRLEAAEGGGAIGRLRGHGGWSRCSASSLLVGQLRAQPRLSRSGGDRVAAMRRSCRRCRRPRRSTRCCPRLDADARARRFGRALRDDTPWAMRWGLYQGGAIGNCRARCVLRELDGTLLPRVAAQIQQPAGRVRPQPEELYVYLKAYLMLGEPEHLDKEHLQRMADLEWADPRRRRTRSGPRHVGALQTPARLRRHTAADGPGREARRPGAQQHPAGVDGAESCTAASSAKYAAATSARHATSTAQAGVSSRSRVQGGAAAVGAGHAALSTAARCSKKSPGRDRAELIKQLQQDRLGVGRRHAALGDPATISAEVTALYEQD